MNVLIEFLLMVMTVSNKLSGENVLLIGWFWTITVKKPVEDA